MTINLALVCVCHHSLHLCLKANVWRMSLTLTTDDQFFKLSDVFFQIKSCWTLNPWERLPVFLPTKLSRSFFMNAAKAGDMLRELPWWLLLYGDNLPSHHYIDEFLYQYVPGLVCLRRNQRQGHWKHSNQEETTFTANVGIDNPEWLV